MNIRKRTGEVVPFQEEKILNAMKKAFFSQGQEIDDRVLDEMLSVVLKRLPENGGLTVERVQDEVERPCPHLMWRQQNTPHQAIRILNIYIIRYKGNLHWTTSASCLSQP